MSKSQLIRQELRYLEDLIDYEDGVDKGPLTNKEVLVYSPAKTGTSTLYHALIKSLEGKRNWENPVNKMLHNHHNALLVRNLRFPSYLSIPELDKKYVIRDLIEYKRRVGEHVDVVTSFREPLSRTISDTFQLVDGQLGKNARFTMDSVNHEYCYKKFRALLEQTFERLHPVEEIEPDFLENEKFDQKTKSCCAYRDGYSILVLCAEYSSYWPAALADHFRLENVEVGRCHLTKHKRIAHLHQRFQRQLVLPKELIWKVYYGDNRLSRTLRWFYAEEEIDGFYNEAVERYT